MRTPKQRLGTDSRRLQFERFRARELLLELMVETTTAFVILRDLAVEAGRARVPENVDGVSVTVNRQWEVGSRWATVCGINVDWVRRWVCPCIPPRWLVPTLPLRHHTGVEHGTRILYQTPPWLPSAFADAWFRFDRPFDQPIAPWTYGTEKRVYEYVQFEGEPGAGYFDERTACGAVWVDSPQGGADVLHGWQADEPPPNPLQGETREAFLKRMKQAWGREGPCSAVTKS